MAYKHKKKPKIILVHGLYFHGVLMTYMNKKLSNMGYDVESFSYKSVSNSMDENAEKLVGFVKQRIPYDGAIHFVGHSLGGILIRKTHHIAPEIFTGRIVTLGTPHNGSAIARVAQSIHKKILGGAFSSALDGNLPEWYGETELGSIAGDLTIGLGLIFDELEKPNDGTVSVNETKLKNITDHITLNISHTSMVYSSKAFKQVDYFLQHGKFNQ